MWPPSPEPTPFRTAQHFNLRKIHLLMRPGLLFLKGVLIGEDPLYK